MKGLIGVLYFQRAGEPVHHSAGFALLSMLHKSFHGCWILTLKHCIFDHLHPSPPSLNQAPTNLFSVSMCSVFFFPMWYLHESIRNCLSVSEFLRREPYRHFHGSPVRRGGCLALEGGYRSALQSHVSHSSLLRMEIKQEKLGLEAWHRRMGVPIGWMCPEFPCGGVDGMAWRGC